MNKKKQDEVDPYHTQRSLQLQPSLVIDFNQSNVNGVFSWPASCFFLFPSILAGKWWNLNVLSEPFEVYKPIRKIVANTRKICHTNCDNKSKAVRKAEERNLEA